MKYKRLTFAQVPLTVTMALAKDAEILQFEDEAIELHLHGAHLLTWTKAGGWEVGNGRTRKVT